MRLRTAADAEAADNTFLPVSTRPRELLFASCARVATGNLLLQGVHLDQTNTGAIAFSAYDGGVVARREIGYDRSFKII